MKLYEFLEAMGEGSVPITEVKRAINPFTIFESAKTGKRLLTIDEFAKNQNDITTYSGNEPIDLTKIGYDGGKGDSRHTANRFSPLVSIILRAMHGAKGYKGLNISGGMIKDDELNTFQEIFTKQDRRFEINDDDISFDWNAFYWSMVTLLEEATASQLARYANREDDMLDGGRAKGPPTLLSDETTLKDGTRMKYSEYYAYRIVERLRQHFIFKPRKNEDGDAFIIRYFKDGTGTKVDLHSQFGKTDEQEQKDATIRAANRGHEPLSEVEKDLIVDAITPEEKVKAEKIYNACTDVDKKAYVAFLRSIADDAINRKFDL